MHPLIEEIKRASVGNLSESAFKRWQQRLEHEIQPELDRVEELERENIELRKRQGGKRHGEAA